MVEGGRRVDCGVVIDGLRKGSAPFIYYLKIFFIRFYVICNHGTECFILKA
jgi:hypothetical protein